jgi:UDP-N-acetylglucosamine acyltransferase
MSQSHIHPTAIIESGAQIGANVKIGPFCIVGSQVKIDEGCELLSHVVISGRTTIGKNNVFHSHAAIGGSPQDLTYKNEDTETIIGDRNTFRECVTVHRGTAKDRRLTRVGNDNYFMVSSHIAHDCTIGNHCVFANLVSIAGHCTIGNYVNIGGMSGVVQKARVGDFAFLAGQSALRKDLPPFMCARDFSEVTAANVVGLKRAGFSEEEVRIAREIYKTMFLGNLTTEKAAGEIQSRFPESAVAKLFIDFTKDTVLGIQR